MFLELGIKEEINEEVGVWCGASTTFIEDLLVHVLAGFNNGDYTDS